MLIRGAMVTITAMRALNLPRKQYPKPLAIRRRLVFVSGSLRFVCWPRAVPARQGLESVGLRVEIQARTDV